MYVELFSQWMSHLKCLFSKLLDWESLIIYDNKVVVHQSGILCENNARLVYYNSIIVHLKCTRRCGLGGVYKCVDGSDTIAFPHKR